MTTTAAPAAPAVDPWAFLENAVQTTELVTVKAPTPLADIPNPIKVMLEKALTEAKVMKVRFPNEGMARQAIRFFKAYALSREATAVVPATDKSAAITHTGPVSIRATQQNDKTVVHFTVKPPYTPTPTPVIPIVGK
jgi:hypothetical protein